MTPELSEFEKRRLENIKRNQELLKSLEFDSINDSIVRSALVSKPILTTRSKRAVPSTTSNKRRTHHIAKTNEAVAPLRKSRRLQGIKADDEVAREEAEKASEAQRDLEVEKRTRVGGDIDLENLLHVNDKSEAAVDDRAWEQMWYNFSGGEKVNEGDFFDKIKYKDRNEPKQVKQEDGIDTYSVNRNKSKSIPQLREEISSLQLDQRFDPADIRMTPERIFSMAFHPTLNKPLIFAGDKVGTLGIWDAFNPLNKQETDFKERVKKEEDEDEDNEPNDEEQPNILQLKIHTRTVSSIRFSPESTNTTKLFTSSYDGSIRLLDLNKKVSSEMYVYPSDPRNPVAISDLCFAGSDPNLLYFTTLEGQMGRKDIRQDTKNNDADLYRLHDKKIGGFHVNPIAPHLVVTASLDRTMKLWDMRMINKKEDSESTPHLCGVYDSRLSISCAEWNGNNNVVVNGYDDSIRVFDFNTSFAKSELKLESSQVFNNLDDKEYTTETLVPTARVKHNCQTGRWVTILKSHWQQSPSDRIDRFVIGNMNRYIDVYTADGRQLAHLGHPLMSAVPAVSQFHPTCNWIVGGSASGKAYLWK
ncbi:WD40 repeat-like protein [Nadsonia fulvescens var. elongata DSM 6958]|uniref:DNA damage-binding protein CMR1 n=1 Tax=Nadsonia fulvescens var. elongata DSM 6958 TaxID=857566 RepID=A0A1E3PQN3_9ASCO|nr:WD40 repeat-like protein [Nadsonia fulvescens var. elongata DSM 6958]